MAFAVGTVTAHIAALSITATLPDASTKALVIRDLADIPPSVEPRDCPFFYPDPTNLWSGGLVERDSYGSGATAQQTLKYDLRYRLLYAPVGSERALGVMGTMATTIGAIIEAIMDNDNPGGAIIDLRVKSWTTANVVADPSGKQHHGCDFVLAVEEHNN